MNKIVIEFRNGLFLGFWVNMFQSQLIFVAGGRVGDSEDFGLRQAERRADDFRETHHEIDKVVFKKLKGL